MTPRVTACTFRFRSCLVVLLAMIVLSACDLPPPEGSVEVPCDRDEGTVLELGSAGQISNRYGQFSTTGATIWVSVRRLATGGIFDTDQTRIDVGWASDPPEYNTRTGEVNANVLRQVVVKEGYWSPLELEAGDYWLWSTAGGRVTVQACTAGAIFDPVPATIPPDPAGLETQSLARTRLIVS